MDYLDVITLAITETKPNSNQFNIVAYRKDSNSLEMFDLKEDQIISESKEIMWDIAFSSRLSDTPTPYRDNRGNVEYTIKNNAKLGVNVSHDLKYMLESFSKNAHNFFSDQNIKFCVLKVSEVKNISITTESDGNNKHYLEVCSDSFIRSRKILIKDLRWKKYWDEMYKNDKYEEVSFKYLDILNKKDKDLYLILYRRTFSNSSFYWITGVHLL